MTRTKTSALTAALFMAIASPAAADKGGGHEGDTSPGNSGEHKVTICHHAGPTKTITITVDESAVAKHISQHGDTIGACPPPVVPPVEPPVTEEPPVVTEGTPTPGVEQPAGTPEAPGVVAPPKQVKSPEKVAAKRKAAVKHSPERSQRVAEVRRAQRELAKRVEADQKQQELPHTGFPAALLALAGISSLAGGIGLRRKG